jgi:hypothetical protein
VYVDWKERGGGNKNKPILLSFQSGPAYLIFSLPSCIAHGFVKNLGTISKEFRLLLNLKTLDLRNNQLTGTPSYLFPIG